MSREVEVEITPSRRFWSLWSILKNQVKREKPEMYIRILRTEHRIKDRLRSGDKPDLADIVADLIEIGLPEDVITDFLERLEIPDEVIAGTINEARRKLIQGLRW